jgi:hypothetical protein
VYRSVHRRMPADRDGRRAVHHDNVPFGTPRPERNACGGVRVRSGRALRPS